jgi:uncharacterized alkaline shock family protein YloU
MKNAKYTMPPSVREVCSAVCAIVHANIIESGYFKQSRSKKRTKLTSIKKDFFSDHGVDVEVHQGMINIKIYVSALIGQIPIYDHARDLQKNIAEEVMLLTSFQVRKIDVIIKSLRS